MKANILVTGATGFLGAHLVERLVAAGETIRVMAQKPSQRLAKLGVEVVAGSVTRAADVEKAVAGVNRIYHLAGMVSRDPDDGHRMFDVHVNGTRVLCEAAVREKVGRMVLVSTSGTVAVSRREDEMPDEESPAPVEIIGRWPYYASKLYQEEAARRFADRLEIVTVNPSLLLGPGDERLSSTRDVLDLMGRKIPLVPGGGVNFVDARDVAAVLPVAMEKGRPGERYLLGGTNWTFADFFARLARIAKVPAPALRLKGSLPRYLAHAQARVYEALGRTPPLAPESVEMAEYFWYFDSKKAKAELGFEPRDATDTLFDTVTWLRKNVLGRDVLVNEAAAAG